METVRLRTGVLLLVTLAGCVRAGFDGRGSDGRNNADSPGRDNVSPISEKVFGGTPDPASWAGVGLSSTELVVGAVRLQEKTGFAVKSAALPSGRAWGAAERDKDRIYVFAGGTKVSTSIHATDEVLTYQPTSDAIQPVAKLPYALSGVRAVATSDGKIAVVMGIDPTISKVWEAQAHTFDPTQLAVTKTCSGLYGAYHHAVAAGPNGLVYSFGGYGSGPLQEKIEAYDPQGCKVVPVAATLPAAREKLSAHGAPNGSIYIFGGALVHDDAAHLGGQITTQILRFTPPASIAIVATAKLPQPLINMAGGLLPDGQIYLVGGDAPAPTPPATRPTTGVLRFDPKTETLTTLPDTLPAALSGAAAAVGDNGKLYLFGGLTVNGLSTQVLELHPYTASGDAVGPVIDTGAAPWRELDWQAQLPQGTALEMYARAADAPLDAAAPLPQWQLVASHPASSGLPPGRYFQWRVTLKTSNTALTPTLTQVKLRYGTH